VQESLRRQWPGARIASELTHPLRWNGVTQSTHVHYLPQYTLDWYRQQGFGLLLATSSTRRAYGWTEDYKPLVAAGQVVATAGGPGSRERGPRIDAIATGLTAATLPSHAPQAQVGPVRLLGVTPGRLVDREGVPEVEPGRQLKAGDALALITFWVAGEPAPPANYMVFVQLRDQEGHNVAQLDIPPWQGLFPPQTWRPDVPVVDRFDLALPGDLPPGEYRLVCGLYDSSTQVRFPAFAGGAHLPNDEVDLGLISVIP
jgi:hypothetical protein